MNTNIVTSKIPDDLILSCLNTLSSIIWIIDAEGNYVYVNDSYLKVWGISREQALSYNVHNLPTECKPIIADIVLREKKSISMFQTVYDYRSDRKMRQFVTETPIFDAAGNIIYIIGKVDIISINDQKTTISLQNEYDPDAPSSEVTIIANSPAMRSIMETLHAISNVDSSVLITGESGTGKEVIAKELHRLSNRRDKPLIDINCAAIPENLLEAELFGYEQGSFTGANPKGKKGLIEEANGGILFLDEINSMPLSLQGKLLRAIESKSIRRVGGVENIKVDFRVVSATSKRLEKLCYQDLFRSDLYYRLNVIPINLPSLKERKEDIIPLANFFLDKYCVQYSKMMHFSNEAKEQLLNYDWPGNIRQLKNLVERTLVTCAEHTDCIQRINDAIFELKSEKTPEDFINKGRNEIDMMTEISSSGMGFSFDNFDLNKYLEDCEKTVIIRAMSECKTTYELAKKLNISQPSAVRRKQKYNL